MSEKNNYLNLKANDDGLLRILTGKLSFNFSLFKGESRKMLCYLGLMTILVCNISFAQEKLSASEKKILEGEFCHTTLQERLLEDAMNPSEKEDLRLREAILQAQVNHHIIASRTVSRSANNLSKSASLVIPIDPDVDPNYTINPEYTIPVVFHVIHDGDQKNILTLAQAKKVLKIANEDLNGLSEFRGSIQDQFKTDESHVGIRLVLAQKDPNGNPTTGVTYDVNPGTYSTHQNNAASFKRNTKWPTNKYLNIWIVNGQSTYFFTDGDKPSGGSAYAFGPASDNGLTDNGTYTGITMSYWVAGDSVNGATLDYQAYRHVFVHEFGHWLGLNHSWGRGTASGKPSNCNIDDGIADTPNTVGQQYKGKDFENCTYTFASCGVETNVHDFMNYTPCTSMFTNGQKDVMIGSLNSSVAGRNNIVTTANLNETLYTSNPSDARLIVSSEFGSKTNIFREVRDVETGEIENKANIYLENVSFDSNLVGQTLTSTHFQTTNVPAGLSAEIKVIDATTAEFRLNGSATQHETSNSITNLTLDFNNAAFNNAMTSSIDNATNIVFSVAFRGKIGSPWSPLDYELLYNNSYGEKYGFYERRRTKLSYGNSIIEFKFESDQLFVRLATPSSATGIVLDNNGNDPGVDQVSVLQFGDVVDQNSNWSVSNADASAEKGWKRVISQNQADIANYLNKDLYFGTYLQYGGRTFYQWIGFTLFKTEYDKMAVRLTDLAYGANPDEPITCGKGFYERDSWMVRDLFFMEEARANDGTLYTKSMNFFVRGNTFKSTLSPSDYTVTNLPAGLAITSVEAVNNGRKLQFNLGGAYTNPDAGRVNTEITLKASAFTNTTNIGPSLTNQYQFQFYTNKEGYIVRSVNKTVDSNTNSYTVVGGIKFEYKVDYTKAIPEGRIVVNGKSFGQSVKYSPKFMADGANTNNAKLLGAGVMLDENAGLTFPIDLGDDIIVYDKDYTTWAGKEGYLGFQYAIGSFRHYVWIKIKVAANGESVEILDYALNRIIDTPIETGELPPPTCDDGIQNGEETNVDCGGPSCQECTYCVATNEDTGLNITNVTFAGIDNSTTGDNAYIDFTNISGNVAIGSQMALTIDINNSSWSGNAVGAWIDWNNDKDFDDDGEKVFSKYGGGPYSTAVAVAGEAVSGTSVRMRVRIGYGSESKITPCGEDTYLGETEDYTINIVDGSSNVAPTASITSPVEGAEFDEGNDITIEASATDSDGTVAKVEFFDGVTKLGEDTTSPYSFTWSNATAGDHSITVKATDDEGAITESSAVNITVNEVVIVDPEYCIATNEDTGLNITNVSFGDIDNSTTGDNAYVDFTNISTTAEKGSQIALTIGINNSSWSFNAVGAWIDWNNDKDFDDDGEKVFSKLGAGPYTENVTVPAGAVSGASVRMRVRIGYGSESKITPCGEDTYLGETEDYTINIADGSSNVAPTASITSPIEGAEFDEGNDITIEASATDSDGTVAKVEFFDGITKLGEDTTSPYSFTWSNATAGDHSITVKATDDEGAITESSAVNITVNEVVIVDPEYCIATNEDTGLNITNVSFGDIDNSTTGDNAYVDFTNISTTAEKESEMALTIGINNSSWSFNAVGAWIDWNNDKDFDDDGEKVFSKLGAGPYTENVTVPAGAISGASVRMRVRIGYGSESKITPCGEDTYLGETEDYTINIVGGSSNVAPTASITSPIEGAEFDEGNDITIEASATDSDGTVAKVEFFDGITKLGEDTTSPYSFIWSNATAGDHSITVKATDDEGAITESSAVNITVNEVVIVDPEYCIATNEDTGLSITNVSFGDIDNSTTGDNAYVDFTNISTTAEKESEMALTIGINNSSWSFNAVGAWIDWNNDKDFDDDGEKVFSKLGAGPYTENVTVPAGAISGASVRMRVRIGYGSESKITPCGEDTYLGETEDYTIAIVDGTPNVAPIVSITSPSDGAQFDEGTSITIEASASDSDGTVTKVEFFDGTTSLGEDTSAPYSMALNNASVGDHTLKAVATDNDGATTEATISITVNGTTSNVAPTVSITSPVNNAEFEEENDITIEAAASDSDGTITKVEFFDGAIKLGEDTTAPYSYDWRGATLGVHNLTVKATDNEGAVTESATINITVNSKPNIAPVVDITSPSNGAEFDEGASIIIDAIASDSDGSVTKVEFFDGTILLGEDISAPYSITFDNATIGNHTLKAVVTDNDGTTSNSTVTITVSPNVKPNSFTATPNPFTGNMLNLNFNSSKTGVVKVEIFSPLGVKVFGVIKNKGTSSVLSVLIDKELTPGLYIIGASFDGTPYATKIIVE